MGHIIKDSGADTRYIAEFQANELEDRGWVKRCAECEDDHPGDRVYHTTHPETDDVDEILDLAGPWFIVAVIVAVRAPNADAAYSAVTNSEDPNGYDRELYGSPPYPVPARMVLDPDFDATVRYHGQPLEPTKEDY